MTIPAADTIANQNKGTPIAQPGSGPRAGADHNLFASLLSSSDLSSFTQKETPLSGGAGNGLPDVLKNLIATLVPSLLAQPILAGRAQPSLADQAKSVVDSRTNASLEELETGSKARTGKKEKRTDGKESLPVQAVVPIQPELKLLLLSLATDGGTGLIPTADALVSSSLNFPLLRSQVPNAGLKIVPDQPPTATSMRPTQSESVPDPATKTVRDTGVVPAAVVEAVSGHLSFLLKLVNPARSSDVGQKAPTVRSEAKPTNLPAGLPVLGAAAETVVAAPTSQGLGETSLTLPSLPATEYASEVTAVIALPVVPASMTPAQGPRASSSLVVESGVDAPPTRPVPAISLLSLTMFSPAAPVAPAATSAERGFSRSFRDQPGTGQSAPATMPVHQETRCATAPIESAKLDPKKYEAIKVNDGITNFDPLPDFSGSAQLISALERSQPQPLTASTPQGKTAPEPIPTPRSPSMPSLTPAPQATAASQISIRLDAGNDSGQVELRIRERAGEVQIAVRSTDRGVATTLRQDLGDLVRRLAPHTAGMESLHQDASALEPGGYSYFSDDAQQQQRQRQQQQQHHRQPLPQPEASVDSLEELRTVLHDFSTGAFAS